MLNIRFAYRFFLSELKTYGYGPAEQYQQAKLLGEDMTGIKHFGWWGRKNGGRFETSRTLSGALLWPYRFASIPT